jgi:hypothetical protein
MKIPNPVVFKGSNVTKVIAISTVALAGIGFLVYKFSRR